MGDRISAGAKTLDVRLVRVDVRTLMKEAPEAKSQPLTLAPASRKTGEGFTVGFRVETAARVTDITDKENPRPLEVQLLDVVHDGGRPTPGERAGIIMRIPA